MALCYFVFDNIKQFFRGMWLYPRLKKIVLNLIIKNCCDDLSTWNLCTWLEDDRFRPLSEALEQVFIYITDWFSFSSISCYTRMLMIHIWIYVCSWVAWLAYMHASARVDYMDSLLSWVHHHTHLHTHTHTGKIQCI